MKLLTILKTILSESRRIKLSSFRDDDRDLFNVIATIHTQDSINKSSVSATRVDIDLINDVIITNSHWTHDLL